MQLDQGQDQDYDQVETKLKTQLNARLNWDVPTSSNTSQALTTLELLHYPPYERAPASLRQGL